MRRKFVAVFRVRDEFVSPQSADEARGFNPDEIWFFGKATSPVERAIEETLRAAAIVNEIEIRDSFIGGAESLS